MNNWTPVVLPLSPNPSPRYNHAAAIFPELDIMIVDGGATERHQQSDRTTFILDMKCPSYTGWRWASEVTIGKSVTFSLCGVGLSFTYWRLKNRTKLKIIGFSEVARTFLMKIKKIAYFPILLKLKQSNVKIGNLKKSIFRNFHFQRTLNLKNRQIFTGKIFDFLIMVDKIRSKTDCVG